MTHKPAFSETRTGHLALTQLHRWYQLYEVPMTPERIALQLEILAPDVDIQTTRGQVRGHDEYLRGIGSLDPADRNSHRVQSWAVTAGAKAPGAAEPPGPEDGTIALSAETIYQRQDGSGVLTGAHLHYEATLQKVPGGLPVFRSIHVAYKAPAPEPAFVDALPDNRVRSYLHRWLSLMEDLGGSADAFRELLLQTGFELRFSSAAAPITTHEQLAAWNGAVAAQLQKSSHRASDLRIGVTGGGYEVAVDFAWRGVDRAGLLLEGRAHHDWLLEDTGERFCRMKLAQVKLLEEPHPVAEG